MVILSDQEPKTESEQLKLGLFHDHMDVWADKSLTFMAFKNGAISSQSEHSALDGIGKKHAFKKYDQFALDTSCFWGSAGSNITQG